MKNPSYSLRAFARQLGVNKTSLLDFLNGKRCVSSKILDAIERRALSGTTAMM